MATGIELIAAERERQLAKWPPEHDDERDLRELIQHAAVLVESEVVGDDEDPNSWDDWELLAEDWDTTKRLVVAGALIAAEIDRLQRLKEKSQR